MCFSTLGIYGHALASNNCIHQIMQYSCKMFYKECYSSLTHCSVWHPGPEKHLWKQTYLLGWFVYFQDMVEHAIAEEIAGKRIAAPGVYLNEMPYPCYEKDL